MTHPLDGAKLKVVRAQEHLDALKVEVGRYLDTNPYEFPTEHDGDTVTAKPAIVKAEPPLRLSCVLGDCLTNLRASLDYVGWQLALRYSPSPLVIGKDKISFPIAKDSAAFAKRRSDLQRYAIPAAAISLIESVQPYQAGYGAVGLLNALVNEDKHCLPLLTIACADTASIEVTSSQRMAQCVIHSPCGATIQGSNVSSVTVQRIAPSNGNEGFTYVALATIEASGPGAPEQLPGNVKVNGQVAVFVSLKNPLVPSQPVDWTLEQIIKCVANIIPGFGTFL